MRKQKDSRWFAEIEMQVQFFDLDPMEIVWHGRYVKYLEIVRCALLDKIGYNYPQMKESGYAWPVIDMQLRYVGSATFGQKLKLRADIVEWENRLKIDYLITDAETGKRLNRASTTMVAVDIATREYEDDQVCRCSGVAGAGRLCASRRAGRENPGHAGQAAHHVRTLRPDQTACRHEEAAGGRRPFLRRRRQGRFVAHAQAVPQHAAPDPR
jgi:acyl-CoA thioester hydrolase